MGKLIVAKGFKKLPEVQKSPNLVTLERGLIINLIRNFPMQVLSENVGILLMQQPTPALHLLLGAKEFPASFKGLPTSHLNFACFALQ